MNKVKVRHAIKVIRRSKEDTSVQYVVEYAQSLLEALEEIASPANSLILRDAISLLSRNLTSTIHSRDCSEKLSKLRGLIESIQVPKEVLYAYPVTMQRHFAHYGNNFNYPTGIYKSVVLGACETDDFGCEWQQFTGPKELVDYLRENNIPIKVIQ